MKHLSFIYLLSFILIYTSCSFNTPSAVLAKEQRIYSYNQQGALTEWLAVFMLIEDNDGRNDYKGLILRENATGLEWALHRENTVFLQEAGYSKNTQWVGSNKFKYPRRFFPAGQYTLTASDLGGNKTELSFSLQEPQPLTVYQLQINDAERQNGSFEMLENRPTDARYIQCFGENSDQSIGFLSTPLPLP